MSDYYTQRDQDRPGHRAGYPDYAKTGSVGTWVWVAVLLVAIVALVGLGVATGGDEPSEEGAAIEVAPTLPDTPVAPELPAN